jgi:hypothetical protein
LFLVFRLIFRQRYIQMKEYQKLYFETIIKIEKVMLELIYTGCIIIFYLII